MKKVHLLLAVVTLVIIVAVAVWEWRHLTSPGPLHPSHIAVTDLQGNAGCAACHGKSDTVMADACSSCHQDVKQQIDLAHGLHGTVQHATVLACARCHTEHSGANVQLVADRSFQVAGFPNPGAFDHEKVTRFGLLARHAELKCEQCHVNALFSLLVKGQKRFLGLSQDCKSCHKDPHEGTYGPDCAACHGQAHPFKHVDGFVHTTRFPLEGGHANKTCQQCHEKTGPYSVESLQITHLPVRSCIQCHPSPHSTPMIAAVATSSGKSQGESCIVCHLNDHKTFLSPTALMTAELHKTTGFDLDAPHAKVQCAQCHTEIGKRAALAAGPDLSARFAAFYPGRATQACEACHADPHRGQFAASASQGKCIACHAATHFVPNTFDQMRHEKTQFPLTGGHKAVGCSLCHKKQDDVIQFVSTPTVCAKCHVDVHDGKFDAPDKPMIVNGNSGCARCHTTAGFGQIRWTAQDHGLWAGYALNAAHATASCVDCHKQLPRPDAHGRTLGLAPKSCSACHADPHAGQLALQNQTDCARCHTDTAKFTFTTFDHQRDSAFKLDEVHMKLACAACHRAVELAPSLTVIRYRPLGTRCEDCHGQGKG